MHQTEDELLAAIRKVLSGAGPEVVVGPGDDAAVLEPGSGQQVLTTDALVEGTHFERALTSARDLGAKAIEVNVSDVAAMAASPRAALCALTLTDDVDAAWVVELLGGMREACDEHALWLVGGNLARGRELAIVMTVVGEVARGRAVTRAGARTGDQIVVTGALGAAAAGLRVARSAAHGLDDAERAALRSFLRPTARVGEAGALARRGATAMIDLSDGLALDLRRLCTASGVGAAIRRTSIPVAPGATERDALGGGEDYELLATLPSPGAVGEAAADLRSAFGVPLTSIGVILEEGLVLEDEDGSTVPMPAEGWDHFRDR